jgi:hypothetical protein
MQESLDSTTVKEPAELPASLDWIWKKLRKCEKLIITEALKFS